MVYIITYGCKVNQYESLQVANLLEKSGQSTQMLAETQIDKITDKNPIFVVNSCAVTGKAEKKSRYGISKIKRAYPNAQIYEMGCAFGRKTPKQLVTEILGRIKIDETPILHRREKAFVKVQDGCKNFCSFCIIPYIRNELVSREIDDVVAEIMAQPKKVEEIILSGINLSYYRTVNGGDLTDLCGAVDGCGKRWYISSLEPLILTQKFLSTLKKCKNFLPKFHICLQSGCDKVLMEMNRHYTTVEFANILRSVRVIFPTAEITTDVIVGYPTETNEDFNMTFEFVKSMNFNKIHIFPYSPRSGTVGAKLKPLTNSLVTDRFNMLNSLNGKSMRDCHGCNGNDRPCNR